MLLGEFEGGSTEPHAEMPKFNDHLGDVVAPRPAIGPMQLPLDRGIDGASPKPVGQAFEQIRNMIVELGTRQSSDLGSITVALDDGPPDGENRFTLFIDMIRQQGGFAHG